MARKVEQHAYYLANAHHHRQQLEGLEVIGADTFLLDQERNLITFWEKKAADLKAAHPRAFTGGQQYSPRVRNVRCQSCGKLTHSVVDGCVGLDLCRECYAEASADNHHNDEGHPGSLKDCAECQRLRAQLV